MEHPALLHQLRPLLLQNLKKCIQGIHIKDGIQRLPNLDHLGEDELVAAEEGKDHLLCGAHMHPCLKWAWLTIFDPLLGHFLGFRNVEGHNGFIHGQNSVEKGYKLAANSGGEVAAGPDPLLFLLLRQKLGNPSGLLFYQAQVLVKDGKNHAN